MNVKRLVALAGVTLVVPLALAGFVLLQTEALGTKGLQTEALGTKRLHTEGSGPKLIPVNPESGMSDSQREELHRREWDAFQSRYVAWLANLDISKLSLAELPRYSLNASYVPPMPSLPAAVQKADFIVIGTVTSIRPTAFAGTDVTMALDRTLKGRLGSVVTFTQGGGLRPGPDWKGAVIASGDNEPLLLPGERAMLFLQRSSHAGLEVQGFSGYYKIVSGSVTTLPLNPFGPTLNGKEVSTVLAIIEGLLKT